mgnify:CR=1 FL=1
MEYRNIVHFYKNLYINLGLDLLPIEIINFLKTYIPREWDYFVFKIRKELILSNPEFYIHNYKSIPNESEANFISKFYQRNTKYFIKDKEEVVLNPKSVCLKDYNKKINEEDIQFNKNKNKKTKTQFLNQKFKVKKINTVKKTKINKPPKEFKFIKLRLETLELEYNKCKTEKCNEMICGEDLTCYYCLLENDDKLKSYYENLFYDDYDYDDYYYRNVYYDRHDYYCDEYYY